MSEEPVERSVFERHAQTVIGAVLLALLLWTGSSLIDVRDRLGRIEVYQINANQRDIALDSQMSELRRHVAEEGGELRARMRELELSNAKSERSK
jgi:hypothetical protein